MIKYTVEQACKAFSASEIEDFEKIRKDIQELNISLTTRLPEAVEKAVRKEVAEKQKSLDEAEKNVFNIRWMFFF